MRGGYATKGPMETMQCNGDENIIETPDTSNWLFYFKGQSKWDHKGGINEHRTEGVI